MMTVTNATDLLEREAELAELRSDLAGARMAAGRLVLVDGPAGIGKTALLRAARSLAESTGVAVARARGSELESGFAFGVVRQLFEPLLRACSQREKSQLLTGPTRLAARLLSVADDGSIVAGDRVPEVMHGLFWLTFNLAERRPLLLLVDDAHLADPLSLRFVSYLAGRLEGVAVLAMVAVRRDERPTADEVLAEVSRELNTRTTLLKPLSGAATAELVKRHYGGEIALEFAEACWKATGGNPFLVRELVRALHADGIAPSSARAARVAEQGPASIARSVLTRIAGLLPAAGAVARTLAVLGGEATLRDLTQLSGLDEGAVDTAVDRLERAGIIVGADPVAFAHPILRASLYADIPGGERRCAHRHAARLLATIGAPPERVAAHLIATRPAGDPWAASLLAQAAGEALSRGAPDAAVAYLTRALAEPPAECDRRQLVALLGRAEYLAHHPGATAHLIEAMHAAPTVARRGELALQAAKALIMAEPDRSLDAIQILDRAISEIGQRDSQLSMRLEAHLLAAAGLKLATRELHSERIHSVCGRPLGDDPAARRLLANLAFWTLIDGRTPGLFDDLARHAQGSKTPAEIARHVAERALGTGQLLSEEGSDSQILYLPIATLYIGDFLDRSEHWLDRAIEDARKRGSILGYAQASAAHAEVAYRKGQLDAAEAYARAAAAISKGDALAVLIHILIEQGKLDQAEQMLDPFPLAREADHLMLQPIRAAAGRLRLAQRRTHDGTLELLACARWLEAWPARNPGVASWRSSLALALGGPDERDHARQLAEEEIALARSLGQPRALGIALRALGLLEQGADGLEILREAITELERSPARLEHARALIDYGAASRRRGHRADARKPLREGLDLAHQCRANALMARAHQELLATGARPRRAVLSGRDALTPTELRVAQMATQGHSTPEIAQALFVTPKTIETHLSHTYQKLGIHSRAGLAQALTDSHSHTPAPKPPEGGRLTA